MKTEIVFQYFFSIGAGLACGLLAVIVPAVLAYQFISQKLKQKRSELDC